MRERPILFSGAMVRAILEGKKTQTRRVAKLANQISENHRNVRLRKSKGRIIMSRDAMYTPEVRESFYLDCPYGVPGDQLWVKETWTGTWCYEQIHLVYRADGAERFLDIPAVPADYALPKAALKVASWVTPLFMPRWASRITLEITDVRVQRLQEISEEDAVAEGIYSRENELARAWYSEADPCGYAFASSAFQPLWDSINAKKHPWESNPWVWALAFRRMQ